MLTSILGEPFEKYVLLIHTNLSFEVVEALIWGDTARVPTELFALVAHSSWHFMFSFLEICWQNKELPLW